MYHLAKSLYLWATAKEEYSILLLGLDNAGKTTLLSSIKTLYASAPAPSKPTVPTVGQNVSTIDLGSMYLKLWDVGGQQTLRSLWTSYFSVCHAIIFVVDSSDLGDDRLEECRGALEGILGNRDTRGVPLLVLANKQDREDCVETVRIKEGLVRRVFEGDKGAGVRDSRVLPVSALQGKGVGEAVEWVRTRVMWNKEGREPVMR